MKIKLFFAFSVVLGILSPVCGQARARPGRGPLRELKKDLQLEPLLSFDEAARLAKKNDPRGYYQLALIGRDLSDEMAYEFMKKSADMGYGNARLLIALDEGRHLDEPSPIFARQYMKCGREFSYLFADCAGKYTAMFPSPNRTLASSNDVAEIRRKFEACRIAGVNQATNAIALLDHWARVHEDSLVQKRAEEEKKNAEERQKSLERDIMKDIYSTLTNANRTVDRNVDMKVARLKVEREARQKADAEAKEKRDAEEQAKREAEQKEKEEKARKRAAALEELSGWPRGGWLGELNVSGTNVSSIIEKCCNGMPIERTGKDIFSGYECTTVTLVPLCEKACHVVFADLRDSDKPPRWEAGKDCAYIESADSDRRVDAWNGSWWRKYDKDGRLIKVAKYNEFAEYDWITNQRAVVSMRLKKEWAKKHGLTLESAEKRAAELIEEVEMSNPMRRNFSFRRPGAQANQRPDVQQGRQSLSVGGLRGRRAERLRREEEEKAQRAQKEQERASREMEEKAKQAEKEQQAKEEREQKRAQLLEIQKQLNAARAEREREKSGR